MTATHSKNHKAVVHVSGTLLRQNWYGSELQSCIIVRPAGEQRDTEGYVVHQVKFDGPTEMVFGAKPREPKGEGLMAQSPKGFVGTLPGFDSAIMVYLEADEKHVHVQVHDGDEFIPLDRLKADLKGLRVPMIDPRLEINC